MRETTGQGPDVTTLRFSTDDVPERERFAVVRELFGRAIIKVDFEPLDHPFRLRALVRAMPRLGVWIATFSPMRAYRDRTLITDGNDDVAFCLSREGGSIISHLGRELSRRGGDAVLLSGADAISSTLPPMSRYVSLRLSRKALATMVPGLEDAFVRPVPRESEALRLLKSYINLLEEDYQLATSELQHAVVSHVYDLVALALGATSDAAEIANGRGVRAARLRAIKADVSARPGDPNLNIGAIAARHGVTARHVQRLFEGEGTTFSQFLLGQRLARAHRMLNDTRFAAHTIGTIAFEAGFGDLSHFNRAFRRCYDEAPSDARAAARRDREL